MSEVTVKIHDIARGGNGVAKLESGEVVFVPFTAPNDEVSIRILKKTKTYSQGELVKIIQPSPIRVTAPCPVFTQCGGCSWQHLPYSLQFETKRKGLIHTLKRVGINAETISIDEMPAKNLYHYRNRVQLRGNLKSGAFGFYEKGSNKIVSITRCEIADERINQAIPKLREESLQKSEGKNEEDFKLEVEIDQNGKLRSAWNQKHSAFGFRQVNEEQNAVLQSWVKDHIGSGTHLLDLFGGHGNLSLGLTEQFGEIHCVDISVPRVKPLALPENYAFHASSTLTWLKSAHIKTGQLSVIIDPPREGLGNDAEGILNSLALMKPTHVILVGCDVDSFVKDCARFVKHGFKLSKLGVLDLFPQTPHVESLALFTK